MNVKVTKVFARLRSWKLFQEADFNDVLEIFRKGARRRSTKTQRSRDY